MNERIQELAVQTGPLDQDGYPTEGALNIIRTWNVVENQPFSELMDFIKSIWWQPDYGWYEKKEPHELWPEKIMKRWYISTGGWSGNEDIVRAMQENDLLWTLNWVQSRRGGHYIFEERQFGKE